MLQAINRLPLNQRIAVILRYYEDLTVEEIADHLKASPSTVRSWLSRAMGELRVSIGESERPDG